MFYLCRKLIEAYTYVTVDFIRVAYDVETAVKAIEATEMPNEYAQMLRDGKG